MKDAWGKTAIHRTAAKGLDQITVVLINAGADLNSQDNFGNTPLHAAIRNSIFSSFFLIK